MSIPPPNDPSRGCSSEFSQPLGQQDLAEARNLLENLNRVNVVQGNLTEVVYRTGDQDLDIRRPVYRWDRRPYQDIFANGFQAWPQGQTPNNTYYDLLHFIQHAGAPLDPNRPPTTTHAFVSTTLNNAWQPTPSTQVLPPGSQIQFYRYEVYAPGGIWVAVTLGNRYSYVSQAEVCFAGGIAPQYIRSCLIFTATREAGSRYVRLRRETRLIINRNFNPESAPYNQVVIYIPVYYYRDDNGENRYLPEETYPPMREKRQVLEADNDAALDWYTTKVVEVPSYIDSAFRSSKPNEVYFFLKNKYVQVYYTPGDTKDKILTDLRLICDGFPSLLDTPFGEYGIDCAFDTEASKAYIFSTNLCAYIDYAPGTMDDKILSGPMTIAAMFPVLKNTVFENGIDSAFRSTRGKEVYLFKNNKYVRIAYDSKQLVGSIRNIGDGFPILKGTIFESGIDACYASHVESEAYLFKGDKYVRIKFSPGTYDDALVGDVRPILDGWPCLKGILPLDNKGIDTHSHADHEQADPDPCEMEENKESTVAKLQAVKHKSGKSYNQLADETGLTNVYVAQLLRRQAQLKPDTAPLLLAALPNLPEDLVWEMMRPPLRSYDPELILDPTVYRLNEGVMHFGESIKEIINEEFGDGIMSAIDFYCSVDKIKGVDGKDRVVVTFDGKYLPHSEQKSEDMVSRRRL